MNKIKNKILTICLCVGLLSVSINVMAEVVVIVNKSAKVSSLSVDQVSAIFLKKSDTFPDGSAAVAIDLPNGDSIRDEFYEKATNKNANQVKSYWAKRIFTGKGTPNDTQDSEGDVKSWVASDASHIGYASAAAVDDSVKVVLRMP